MSSEYENSGLRIKELRNWYNANPGDRNEATTRLQLIDTLLFECLGWDKRSDCILEERFEGTYSDYSMLCPRRTLIVEAKREGIYFDIPSGLSNRDYSILTLKKDIPKLGDAIEQAAAYCQQRGAPFGIVSNGHQLVAFIGSRQDGLSPVDGRAVVFESLDAMVNDFHLLWKLLSKSGVIERNLQARLMGNDAFIIPNKLSQLISSYPGVKGRNVIQTDLQIMADLIFEDILGSQQLEEEFLQKCYCQSGALSQYALISKSLLSQRYSSLFPNGEKRPTLISAVSKKGISPEILAESISKRPILVLGDVGVGKTIFFRHFINIDARDIFKTAIVLYLNFGAKAAFTKNLSEYVIDEIQRQLLEKCKIDIFDRSFVRAVYHGDIIRFEKGIYGSLKKSDPKEYDRKVIELLDRKLRDEEQFMQDSLEHITKGRNLQVVIFLDNADQRSDEVQQELFVMSESMASNWPATVFLALRPETFQRSKERGAMGAYHLKAFTIAPPRIDQVLTKRLDFGIEISSGRLPSSLLSSDITINLKNVVAFLKSVKITLEYSSEIVEAVDNLSGGNVRLALDFVKRLIGSGHINTRKILDIFEKSGKYYVSLHEFLRSIIYGDAVYFDPDSSPIENLFNIHSLDKREHFLSIILLAHIDRIAQQSTAHGFVGLDNIYDFTQGMGYLVSQVDEHIGRLWKKRLIESAGRVKPIDYNISASAVRITTIGAYHLKRLPRIFVYYDATVTDTPILDRHYRDQILDVADILERLKRGIVFLDYLNQCFSLIDSQKCGIDWPGFVSDVKRNIEEIRRINIK